MEKSTEGVSASKKLRTNYQMLSRIYFRLLPYQILMIVISAVNGIVDGLFASNAIGPEAMSALGLYAPFTHFFYALSIMLVSGSQLLYGIYLVKNQERVHNVFSVDLIVSFLASAALSLIMIFLAVSGVTKGFVTEAEDLHLFNRYLIGNAVGIPGLVLGQQLFAFLSLENQTKRTTMASVVCLVSNAIGDLLFTVVLPLDTLGLGLASSASCWIFFGVQMVYFVSGRSHLKFSMRGCNWNDVPLIIKRGYSGALSRFMEMFRCLVVNALILRCVGSDGLSAFSASNSFLGVIWALPFGMIAVTRMMLSISIGEEDRRSLIDTMRVSLRKGTLLMCGVAAAIIICAVPLTRMFYRDPLDPVYDMTVWGFRILPLCMPLSVFSLNFGCYAQAAQKKLLSVVLPIVDGFVGVSACSLVLIPLLKMNGLYISNVLNGVICILLIVAFAWAYQKHLPRNLEEMLMIPEDFGPSGDDRIDITVRSMEDVADISSQVMTFCSERGIDHRRAYFSALALEEAAGNVVKHGFTKDHRKNHSLEIRVIHRKDGIILRLRDDCLPFDPSVIQAVLDPEDPTHNIGTRLVYSLTKNIRYQQLLGCNVLTAEL